MAGKKGRSGRKKSLSRTIMEAMKLNDDRVPEHLERLHVIATTTKDDKLAVECLIYLVNRSQGNPKAQADLRLRTEVTLTADELSSAIQRALATERDFIQSYKQLPPPITIENKATPVS